jgi:hypothetical protein
MSGLTHQDPLSRGAPGVSLTPGGWWTRATIKFVEIAGSDVIEPPQSPPGPGSR